MLAGLHALAGIFYRLIWPGSEIKFSPALGWNLINTSTLILLLIRQLRCPKQGWEEALKDTFLKVSPVYTLWTIFLALATLWLY